MFVTSLITAFSLITNLQELLTQRLGLSFLSYIDEAFCILAYIMVPIYVRKKKDAWLYLILLLPIASILHGITINNLVFPKDRTTQTILQSIINFKLFFYFAILYCTKINENNHNSYVKIFITCFSISLIGYAANIYSPEFFIFSDAVWHLERNRISGFQLKPNDLAIFLGFALVLCLLSEIRPHLKLTLLTILFSLIFFTSSRTPLIASAISILIYIVWEKKNKTIISGSLAILIISLIYFDKATNSFFVTETLSNISQFSDIGQTQYIRALMIYYGLSLSLTFPLGVGAGNFGTVMSAGSPAYELLGVSHLYFFQNMAGIYDSNLAAILGEYGIPGIIIFFLLTYKMLKCTVGNDKLKLTILFTLIITLSLTQPIYAYHVNSINLLLLLFSLNNFKKNTTKSSSQTHRASYQ